MNPAIFVHPVYIWLLVLPLRHADWYTFSLLFLQRVDQQKHETGMHMPLIHTVLSIVSSTNSVRNLTQYSCELLRSSSIY